MSEEEFAAVKSTIADYLQKGWIHPSASPYGVLVIVIYKIDGALCICIDYWLLNKQMQIDTYPIPCIDEFLDRLTKAQIYSKLDLALGYH